MKHTPGPWTVEHDGLHISGHVISPKHDYAGNTASRRDSITDPNSMTAADALLIAAAPELLEALQSAEMALIGYLHQNEITKAALSKARAAIEKATSDRPSQGEMK